MPDARCTRGRVCNKKNTRVSNHRYTASTGIPCAMVLTVSFVLFPVTGLSCHRRYHTTSPSACNVSRLPTCRVHRIPLPTFVTIAKRPS